jgi:hypothetical protein
VLGLILLDFAEALAELGILGQGPAHVRLYTFILILYAVWRVILGVLGLRHSVDPSASNLLRNLAVADLAVSFAITLTIAVSGGFMWIMIGFYPMTICYLIGAVKNRILTPMMYDYSYVQTSRKNMPRCESCGAETEEDGDFCQYCGINLQPAKPTKPDSKPPLPLDAPVNTSLNTDVPPKETLVTETPPLIKGLNEQPVLATPLPSIKIPKNLREDVSKVLKKDAAKPRGKGGQNENESAWACICCGEQNYTTRRKCAACGRIGRW